ncbi:MAG TPA: TonB-dependent receptor [Spirochaetota bacterium]|nr:TonB-dependent receptor [Spirochaetota bacterium]
MKIKSFVFLTLPVLSIIAAYASSENGDQKKSYIADEIIISGTGYEKTLTSTPGGIGIMTEEKIMQRVPVSISDALQDITGVYTSSDSAWGSEISIRGTGRDKVIMLIDGCRVNTSTDKGAQFGMLNPASIVRVEILKGPISSLYGSGSIGGVVNIYTRTGKFTDEPGFENGINTSYESNSSGINTYAFTSYNSNNWYVFGSGSYRRHDNYTDGGGNDVQDSGFNDAEGIINLGFIPAPGHTLELRTQYYEGWDIGIPGSYELIPAATSQEYKRIKRGLVSLDYKLIPESPVWTDSRLHFYWMYIKREVKIINPPSRVEPESDNRTAGGRWTNTFVWANNKLVAGADTWLRTITTDRTVKNATTGVLTRDDTPVPDAYYLSSGIFAEDDIQLSALTLNLGGRFDIIFTGNDEAYVSEYPVTEVLRWDKRDMHEYSWNGHAGASYEFFKGFSTGLLAASGYRAASIEELYKYLNLGGGVEEFGNPELKPERSLFFEYSIHYKNPWLKTSASAYVNFLRDLIAREQIPATNDYMLQNINEAGLYGAEYDITLQPVDWIKLYNNLTYIRGRDTKNDKDLPSIAPLRVISGVNVKAPYGISGFIDTTWTAAQTHVPDGTEESDSWLRLDTGIDIKFNTGGFDHRVSITCTNLLDNEYSDYMTSVSKTGSAFNEPGRSIKCGYSLLF